MVMTTKLGFACLPWKRWIYCWLLAGLWRKMRIDLRCCCRLKSWSAVG